MTLCAANQAFAQATVTLSSQKQYIRGYGGMLHAAWAGDLTAAERTLAFGSAAGQLGLSIARRAAFVARSEVNSSGAAMRRSLMPVRVVIHSSEVSTIFSRSALVRIFSGTYERSSHVYLGRFRVVSNASE